MATISSTLVEVKPSRSVYDIFIEIMARPREGLRSGCWMTDRDAPYSLSLMLEFWKTRGLTDTLEQFDIDFIVPSVLVTVILKTRLTVGRVKP